MRLARSSAVRWETPTADRSDLITSPRNRRVSEAAALGRARRRREQARTLLEGPHLLEEAMAAGAPVRLVFAIAGDSAAERARRTGIEVLSVTEAVLRRLSSAETPQSPVAVLDVEEPPLPTDGDLIVAWGVSDPGNVGTLIRTAAAFGWSLAAGPDTADPWAPKVLRAGAGGHFRTTVCRAAGLGELGERSLVATVPRGGDPPGVLRSASPMALLIGDEAAGLPPEVVAAAHRRVTIPMPGGTESLNAAVVGSILMYEASVRDREGTCE